VTRAKDIRAANKRNVDWGKWEDTKMPASAFPLSRRRSRSFRLGTAYRWRLVRFEAYDRKFRLLVAFSARKEQYRATLALERDRDLVVIASYEFHGTHPGWHLLAACDDMATVPEGVMIGPWQRRVPKAKSIHRSVDFGIKDDDMADQVALEIAAQFFRLHKEEGRML
jgi:hypothetical protein